MSWKSSSAKWATSPRCVWFWTRSRHTRCISVEQLRSGHFRFFWSFWSSIVPWCPCRIQDTKTPKGYAFADFADPASVQAPPKVPRCSSSVPNVETPHQGGSGKAEPCGVQRSGADLVSLFLSFSRFQVSFCKLTFPCVHMWHVVSMSVFWRPQASNRCGEAQIVGPRWNQHVAMCKAAERELHNPFREATV